MDSDAFVAGNSRQFGSLIGRSGSGWAVFSQIATSVICAFFLVLAIQSFKEARAARELEGA